MQCDHCHEVVVDGVFCTRCGAHQGTTDDPRDASARTHSYAAHPGEHVAHPGLFSTLFPHLGQHKVHEFRWALIAGLAAIIVLWIAGFVTAAILVAAFLVPVLYLIYLYEAQVYRDEPAAVVGFTIGGGAVLGIVLTLAARFFSHSIAAPDTTGFGGAVSIDWLGLLGFGVLFPIVQEVVKPLPSLLLRGRNFPETMDGLTFGVAAGIGFSTAESIINFSAVIGSQSFQTDPGSWIYPLFTIAVLQPVMQGACTGILVASIWRAGRGRATAREVVGVIGAVVGHIAFTAGSLLLDNVNVVAVIFWQAAVVICLLIIVRYLMHYALLEEGRDFGLSEAVCSHCHKHVMAAGFCPNCGMAMVASPHAVRVSRVAGAGEPPPQDGPPEEAPPAEHAPAESAKEEA
jgi:RsiW-degrading membrane proteinase PrsW (M82 family)